MDTITGKSTEFVRILSLDYLRKLNEARCEPADQPMAAILLGERIRLLENTLNAMQATISLLEKGEENGIQKWL